MSKFSKGKNIGIITAALASVALVGVGFSTWVIGTQHTETDNYVSVEVDDVLYKSLRLNVTIADNDGLYFTDDSENLNSEYFHIDNGSKNADRTVSAKFTITVGKDYVAEFEEKCTGIKFDIETVEGYVNNKPDAGDVFTRNDLDTFTYFDALTNIEKSIISGGKQLNNNNNNNVTTTYSFDATLTFGWGSLFEGKAPFTYYDSKIKNLTGLVEKDEYAEKAYQELTAMKKKYSKENDKAKSIKLKASLLGLTSSSTTGN